MIAALRRMFVDDEGAALAEYGIVAAALALPFIAAALGIAATAGNTLTSTTNGMQIVGVNPP